MTRVLLISKPVAPPWNDSGKNLVRDLACALTEHVPTILGHAEASLPPPVRTLPVYSSRAGDFAPRRRDQARVFAALARDREHPLWHYFFAPNPLSCRAGSVLRRLRRRPTVHTVSSAPRDPKAVVGRLFADVHVVLSTHTEQRLLAAGLAADRLVRIPPCVPRLEPPTSAERIAARRRLGLPVDAPLVLYPGDLEFGGGAPLCIEALAIMRRRDAVLVMACRDKTAAAEQARSSLRQRVCERQLQARVRWLGETRDIHALLGASDVVALPSADLYAKMDYPLVLLEAMGLGRAVVVAPGTPAAELADEGAALACAARPDALADVLDRLLDDGEARGELGVRGLRCARDHYAPAVMARAYAALYDGML